MGGGGGGDSVTTGRGVGWRAGWGVGALTGVGVGDLTGTGVCRTAYAGTGFSTRAGTAPGPAKAARVVQSPPTASCIACTAACPMLLHIFTMRQWLPATGGRAVCDLSWGIAGAPQPVRAALEVVPYGHTRQCSEPVDAV